MVTFISRIKEQRIIIDTTRVMVIDGRPIEHIGKMIRFRNSRYEATEDEAKILRTVKGFKVRFWEVSKETKLDAFKPKGPEVAKVTRGPANTKDVSATRTTIDSL